MLDLHRREHQVGPGASSPITTGDKVIVTCYTGYGTTEAFLALERGEVDGTCVDYNTLEAARPDWLRDRKVALIVQYGHYLRNLLHGNLGFSFVTRRNVRTDIATFLPATIELAGYALLVVAPKQRTRAARNDTQLVKPRQARDDVLGNSIADMSLLRIAAHIGEGENSNRRAAGRWHRRFACRRGIRFR